METPTIRYFGSWSGYTVPFRPSEPISEEEAKQRTAYYMAYYNTQDQLIRFEKYLNGHTEWIDVYEYWDNSNVIKRRTMSKSDGSQSIQNFDTKGALIKP